MWFFSSSSLQAEEKVREMEANQGKLCVFDLGVSIGNTVTGRPHPGVSKGHDLKVLVLNSYSRQARSDLKTIPMIEFSKDYSEPRKSVFAYHQPQPVAGFNTRL